ncbi:MAG: hypothetical protein HYR62_05070 [Actinobacteria bacterium]|nr:hypothetical protein [Actinomycetota bacterium]
MAGAPPPDWHEAWVAVLDELDLDVAAVAGLLAEEHRGRDHPLTDPWSPPPGLGPLPLDLRPRADAILHRQITAAHAITHALATSRQQSAMLARVETGHPAGRPAYLDCAM